MNIPAPPFNPGTIIYQWLCGVKTQLRNNKIVGSLHLGFEKFFLVCGAKPSIIRIFRVRFAIFNAFFHLLWGFPILKYFFRRILQGKMG
jgi:hypothetical protein